MLSEKNCLKNNSISLHLNLTEALFSDSDQTYIFKTCWRLSIILLMVKFKFSVPCSKIQVQNLKLLSWTSSTKSTIFFQITGQLAINKNRFQHFILRHICLIWQNNFIYLILGQHKGLNTQLIRAAVWVDNISNGIRGIKKVSMLRTLSIRE